MRRGEVWWVAFGPPIGGEIQKIRPAIILSTDPAMVRLNRVQVVPLTTNVTGVYPGEAIVQIDQIPHKAMADQITTVSKSRVSNFFGNLSEPDVQSVEEAVKLQLGL